MKKILSITFFVLIFLLVIPNVVSQADELVDKVSDTDDGYFDLYVSLSRGGGVTISGVLSETIDSSAEATNDVFTNIPLGTGSGLTFRVQTQTGYSLNYIRINGRNVQISGSTFAISSEALKNYIENDRMEIIINFVSRNIDYDENFGECGINGNNLTWSLDDDGTLTISGNGAMKNYSFRGAQWYSKRENITNVVIESGVTSIGDYAFYNCANLITATIPESVINIGSNAFYECTGLSDLYITDLASYLNIDFAGYASNPFYPQNLYGENNITHKLYINGELSTDIIIPDGVTNINDYAFNRCIDLTSVTIPDSVTSIGENAFALCENLKNVSIGNSVAIIGGSAFNGCIKLTSINIPNSVTSIGFYAFACV